MKKNNCITASSISIIAVLVFLISCKKDDSLDVIPRDRLSDATVWTDENTADVFLNDIYGKLPDGNNWWDPIENWSDNSVCGYSWPESRNIIQQAAYTPSTLSFGLVPLDWRTNYTNIRKCNLFIKSVTESELSDTYKKQRLAEVRFLRAYFYHLLWMTYGGVPLITDVLNSTEQGDAIFVGRSTSDETLAFLTTEFAAVANDLPEVPAQSGRVTKGAALVLKGWCELFAGEFAPSAATNKQIIDDLGGGKVYSLFTDYGGMFMPENNSNKEGIFYKQYLPRVLAGRLDSYLGPTFTKGGAETSWGGIGPTQELVDAYFMANGKPITDPTSGYDAQNPYANREKRFYQSIVYDGTWWYNDTIYTRQGIGSKNQIDLADKDDATNTGYYLRKRLNDKITLGADNWTPPGTSAQHYYYFRYADVLLNYAEAQNEAVGPDPSVYSAINEIRARAELPDLTPGLGQSEMRDAIRHERRVELAFEDKRYWDLIRWRTAHIVLNNPVHGITIVGTPGGFTYAPVAIPGGSKKFFEAKNYLFPIPQYAIDQNPKLQGQQNPGY